MCFYSKRTRIMEVTSGYKHIFSFYYVVWAEHLSVATDKCGQTFRESCFTTLT